MSNRRVFVVCSHHLFCDAVQSVLQQGGIEPVGVAYDRRTAEEGIYASAPDVIVVEHNDDTADLTAAVSRLVYHKPDTRLITMSLANNEIAIYRCQQRVAATASDLLEAVTAP